MPFVGYTSEGLHSGMWVRFVAVLLLVDRIFPFFLSILKYAFYSSLFLFSLSGQTFVRDLCAERLLCNPMLHQFIYLLLLEVLRL